MNNISENPYLKRRRTLLREYSLSTYLYGEIAVERKADINSVMLAVSKLLALHRFNIHLLGYKFLVLLCTRYIVKSDYEETTAIKAIAKSQGATVKFVKDCITASIRYNPVFIEIVSKTLECTVDAKSVTTIGGIVEIVGALFKIYYNYTVESEEIADAFTIDYNRIDLKNGQH